jgi:eukaryotic-like serine/threonine-protein kinase
MTLDSVGEPALRFFGAVTYGSPPGDTPPGDGASRLEKDGVSVASGKALPVGIGDVIDGKFEVQKVLGAGGMGTVVAAQHLGLEQRVALKFIHRDLAGDEELKRRFLREAKAAARLRGEHVCRVLDVATMPDGTTYIVMEFLEGRDLGDVLRDGPLAVEDAVEYLFQACEAIAEAHAAGIVHRDVKPQNLFLTRRPSGLPLVKVLDFGISKLDEGSGAAQTATNQVVGSPAYMSPEQLRSARETDARSDIWSLGVVLYELLAGHPPFRGHNLPSIALAIVSQSQEPIEESRPGLPAGLIAAISRCLRKDPAERFASVAELAAALLPFAPERARPTMDAISQALRGGPLAPRPPARRRTGVIVAGAATFALAAAAAAVGLAQDRKSDSSAASKPAPVSTAATAGRSSPPFDPHNLTFETSTPGHVDKPASWWVLSSGQNAILDATGPHSGARALRLRVQEPNGFGWARHDISASEFRGKLAHLSGWLRTEAVSDDRAGLWMTVEGQDQVLASEDMHSRGITGTTAWKHYAIDLPVPRDAESIAFGAYVAGMGTVWVDDLSIVPSDPPAVPRRLKDVPRRRTSDLALSADGKLIAHATDDAIEISTLDSHVVREIAQPPGELRSSVVGWYPDGSRLLVLRAPKRVDPLRGPGARAFKDLWSQSAAGGVPVRLRTGVACAAAAPSGEGLALCLPGRIVLDDQHGNLRTLYAADLDFARVAWAPDGKHLAVLGFDRDGGGTLLSVPTDGSPPRVLLHGEEGLRPFRPTGIAWISGRRIVYPLEGGAGGTVLFSVAIDARTGEASEPTTLAMIEGDVVLDLSASARGSKLVLSRGAPEDEVRTVDLSSSGATPHASSIDRGEWLVGWALDGAAYFGTDGSALYRHSLDSGNVSVLPVMEGKVVALTPDRMHAVEVRRGPDDLADAYNDLNAARQALYSTALLDGDSQRIGSIELSLRDRPSVVCQATCVIARTIEGQGVFDRIELDTGVLRELGRIDGRFWSTRVRSWSPSEDGTRVAVASSSEIRIIDAATGRTETLQPDHPCSYESIRWGSGRDAGALLAACIGDDGGYLVRIRRDAHVEVLLEDRLARFSDLIVAPGGHRIAFGARAFAIDTWILEGL